MISENFDSAGTVWQTMAAQDNLFIVQKGEYILQRRSKESPYAVVGDLSKEFNDFRLLTTIKLDKAEGPNSSVGLLFMAQAGGKGGFVLELNAKKEFRLRQISDGVYLYKTGSQHDGGWVKMPLSTKSDGFELIEIVCLDSKYDLFINKQFTFSFKDPGYSNGKFGYIIGPASRGKVDYLYIFEPSSADEISTENITGNSQDPGVVALAESIIILKGQVNELNEENTSLRKTIAAMKSGEDEKEVSLKNNEKKISFLNNEIANKESTIDSLTKVNESLQKYKEIVGDKESGDIVISLSKNLKTEREKVDKLSKENAELRKLMGLPKNGAIPKSSEEQNESFELPGQ